MKIRLPRGFLLIAVSALVVLLAADIDYFHWSPVRNVLGILLVLFLPGYAVLAALFPTRRLMYTAERIAVSVGLSIALVIVIGSILIFTPKGFSLGTVLTPLAGLTLVMSIAAWIRLRRAPQEDNGPTEVLIRIPGNGLRERVLNGALIVGVSGILLVSAYQLAQPKTAGGFSEFYLLGSNGLPNGVPTQIAVGKSETIIAGVVNREREAVTYRIEARIDGLRSSQAGPFTLDDQQALEVPLSLSPDKAGDAEKVEILLFKEGKPATATLSLTLWIKATAY